MADLDDIIKQVDEKIVRLEMYHDEISSFDWVVWLKDLSAELTDIDDAITNEFGTNWMNRFNTEEDEDGEENDEEHEV